MIKLNLSQGIDYIHPNEELEKYLATLGTEVYTDYAKTSSFGRIEPIVEWNNFKILDRCDTSYGARNQIIKYFFRPYNYSRQSHEQQPLCVRWDEKGWSWDRVEVIRPSNGTLWTRADDTYGDDYVWPDKS